MCAAAFPALAGSSPTTRNAGTNVAKFRHLAITANTRSILSKPFSWTNLPLIPFATGKFVIDGLATSPAID
jgi:hypothetical protein